MQVNDRVKRIAIVGGTHGNELTGIYLVKKFQRSPQLLQRQTLAVTTLLANPKAAELNRRYVEKDLNRCFRNADLKNPNLTSYEAQRAKAIATQILPIDQPSTELILDLHSTTSNMGITLIPASPHPYNMRLAAYLCEKNPRIRICFRDQNLAEAPMLRSLLPLGFTVEVGPISHGTLDAALFQETEQVIHQILDYIESCNQGHSPKVPQQLITYQATQEIDYPRDSEGNIIAIIHPERSQKDFKPITSGDPLFCSWSGEMIPYQGADVAYPVFINEAAYYEKNLAMVLTTQKTYDVHRCVTA